MTSMTLDQTASPSDAGPSHHETHQAAKTYVTFDLAGECMGVEVANVREILDRQPIIRLPNTSSDVEGVIDIRGESIPVVDMGSRLGLPRSPDSEETRIIVFEIGVDSDTRPIGVFADRVRDVMLISENMIEKPTSIADMVHSPKLLRGIARHSELLILLLDVQSVFHESDELSNDLDPAFL